MKRKKKYNHAHYNSGIVVKSSTGSRVRNLLVSELTEQEAKDELCAAYDALGSIQASPIVCPPAQCTVQMTPSDKKRIEAIYKDSEVGESVAERKRYWNEVHGIVSISHVKSDAEFVLLAEYSWLEALWK